MKKIHSYILAAAALLVFAPGLSAQTTYDSMFGDLSFPADTSGFSEESNIGFKKNISEPKDNKYWLKLEAFATGSAIQTSESVPSDVILVLDLSSSMRYEYKNGQTRLQALKEAVSKFVGILYDDAANNQDPNYAGNRLAIITYSGDSRTTGSNQHPASQIYNITKQQSPDGDGWCDIETYKDELLDIVDDMDLVDENGDENSGTRPELGLQKAIDEVLPGKRDNAHVSLVLFTDGYPVQDQGWAHSSGASSNNGSNSFVYIIANNAIHNAYTIKQSGVTLFTVGLIPEVLPSDTEDYPNYQRVQYFMDLMSSNYPSANIAYLDPSQGNNSTSTAHAWTIGNDGTITVNGLTTGDKDPQGNYFQLVTDETDLSAIFETIASQSGGSPAETFTEESQAVDIVSSSFTLPTGTSASDIKVFTAPYEWDDTKRKFDFGTAILAPENTFKFDNYEIEDGQKVYKGKVDVDDAIMEEGGITVSGNSITVTGFDYADNWCGPVKNAAGDTTGAQGHKIIIMIPIENDTNAVGGPNVATNGAGSGIMDKYGNMLVHFEPPAVALPVNIQIQTTGLSEGESAKYSIKRRVVGKEADGWEYVTSVFVTRHKGQGDDASVFVKGLPPKCADGNYQYMIVEDDWDWTYTLINVTGTRVDGETDPYGPDEDIFTDNFAVNPITFNNSKDASIAPKVRYSESKATNTFSTGTDEYDDFKTNTKSGRTIITVSSARSN